MYLYQKKPRFDSDTGKEIEPILTRKGFISDLTGEFIDTDDYENEPLYTISFEYNNDSEPLWYETYHDLLRELKLEIDLDYGEFSGFIESPYHFANTEGYGCTDETLEIMQRWIKKDKEFHGCGTIEQVFQQVRLKTLKRLIKEKVYTLEELGFTVV